MTLRARVAEALPERVARLIRHVLKRPGGGWAATTPVACPPLVPGGDLKTIHATREALAKTFLKGTGIEIGARHQPFPLPEAATAKYVDRMTAADLRSQYKELATVPLIDTDIIDDGETLATITDATQDFVVANHFIEHCQNPIRTFQNLCRVLKPGGVLFMAVPDKRFTFDIDRPPTSVEHLLRDYREGPEWSKQQHFEEWTRLVNKQVEARVAEEVRHLIDIDYSIHFHVWGAAELLELVQTLRQFVGFELEMFLRNGPESLLIMRKQ
jgi:SAM-dependent methyltransferase